MEHGKGTFWMTYSDEIGQKSHVWVTFVAGHNGVVNKPKQTSFCLGGARLWILLFFLGRDANVGMEAKNNSCFLQLI